MLGMNIKFQSKQWDDGLNRGYMANAKVSQRKNDFRKQHTRIGSFSYFGCKFELGDAILPCSTRYHIILSYKMQSIPAK